MKYKEIIDNYISEDEPFNALGKDKKFINKLFFIYPTLKVCNELLSDIIQDISNYLNVPFHDVKIVGSSHTGFSFIKPKACNEVKLFDDTSDIDIAIINKELFYKVYCDTFEATNGFADNTKFKIPHYKKIFKDNFLKGYIRPDTIATTEMKITWLRFFKELSIEYNKDISAAIYLNEITFQKKLESAFNIYREKVLSNGIK